jgi:predicted amidophosphoribosyltransferase
MEDVFSVEKPEQIINKKIVVVDDTLTTGATLEACVLALQAYEIKDISILTLARA